MFVKKKKFEELEAKVSKMESELDFIKKSLGYKVSKESLEYWGCHYDMYIDIPCLEKWDALQKYMKIEFKESEIKPASYKKVKNA